MRGSDVFVSENMRFSVLSFPHATVFIVPTFDPCVSQRPFREEQGQFIQDIWVVTTDTCKDHSARGLSQAVDVTQCGLGVCACRCWRSVGIISQTLGLQRAQAFEERTR